jgi:hypothetical protein
MTPGPTWLMAVATKMSSVPAISPPATTPGTRDAKTGLWDAIDRSSYFLAEQA